VVEATAGPPEYFVLAYDAGTMEVRSFTGHGRDYVGAVLNLVVQIQRYQDEPGMVVRLYAAPSFQELLRLHRDPFSALRFPGSWGDR
jgi:hypothetical protein